jgi:hypothetical protein
MPDDNRPIFDVHELSALIALVANRPISTHLRDALVKKLARMLADAPDNAPRNVSYWKEK